MTRSGPNRDVDQIERELFVGSTSGEPDARHTRDLAFLTAALFGSIDDATDPEAHETSDE